jgi:hypothetical protein
MNSKWQQVQEERQDWLALINRVLYRKYGEAEAERMTKDVYDRINKMLNELGASENLDALVSIIAMQKMADSQMCRVLELVQQVQEGKGKKCCRCGERANLKRGERFLCLEHADEGEK